MLQPFFKTEKECYKLGKIYQWAVRLNYESLIEHILMFKSKTNTTQKNKMKHKLRLRSNREKEI